MPEAPGPGHLRTPATSGGADMRRADDAEREAPYDRRAACEKATNAFLRFGSAG